MLGRTQSPLSPPCGGPALARFTATSHKASPTRMLGQTLAIARNTFVESIRQPIFFVLILAGALMQVFNTLLSAFSMGFSEQTEVSGDDKLLLDMGLATVIVCATLLAAFVATSVLSREIENKTALTVISKPIGRPMFVVGKYLGVTSAIIVAAIILLVFFQFAIRHKVMSTARDEIDGPVALFASLAIVLPIALGIWGNYFYGWVFSSTTIFAMFPATVLAYLLTLTISKDWAFQSISTDVKPQVMIASLCALLAIIVLSAVAVAASTRLGQVMTLVVCAGVFMMGLLSNHLLGRNAFLNRPIGMVREVVNPDSVSLAKAGETLQITFQQPPRENLAPGTPIYFGPDPTGLGIVVPAQQVVEGDLNDSRYVIGSRAVPALVIKSQDASGVNPKFTLLNTGSLAVGRPPERRDYVFLGQTRSNWGARIAWSLIPNLQTFWLVDAVTQGSRIPLRYVGMLGVYTVAQTLGLLSLAIFLFQRRDVG